MKSLTIEFLNGDVFYPGQTLHGRVLCYNSKPFKLRSVELKIKGKGNVSWTESETQSYTVNGKRKTRRVTKHYSNSEVYCEQKYHLLGTGESCEIEAGERALNFSFVIPHQIPSSYSDDIGKIKYVAKAKVDIPWATDIESEKEFYVRDYLTLNQLPSANEVIKRENSKHLCCCCCESGPITCRCWLPKQFYLPHEQISFSAEIENLSNQRMRGSYLKMIQMVRYHAREKTRSVEKEIFTTSRSAFDREDYWSDFKIAVPNVPPSPFRFNRIIEVGYEIRLAVDPGFCSVNLSVKLPIMIGTVAIINGSSGYECNPMCNPTGPIGFSTPQLTQPDANIGFSTPFNPYLMNPVHPPNVDNSSTKPMSATDAVQPDAGVGFSPPGQPHLGGYSYYPVPSAPVDNITNDTSFPVQPPGTFPVVQPPQGGHSYSVAPNSITTEAAPPTYDECVSAPVSASPVPYPTPDSSHYSIQTSLPYTYKPAVSDDVVKSHS